MPRQVFFAAILITLATTAHAEVCLVSQGQPHAVVVLADEPTRTARYAAAELVEHVNRATGVELHVVKESQVPTGMQTHVFLGATKAAAQNGIDQDSLGREAYVLRSVGDDLLIVGRDDDEDPLSPQNPNVGAL